MFYPIKKTDVNELGMNSNIKFHILSENAMKMCGFGFISSDNRWYFYKGITEHISLEVTIESDETGKIEVLDNYWLRPYDFQTMIESGNPSKVAVDVQKEVYMWMNSFSLFGIIEGWEWGDYI